MTYKNIQNQLAQKITDHNRIWPELLANTDLGNYAPSYWDVTLKPTDISLDITNKTFTFKNSKFSFDVRVETTTSEVIEIFTKQVSGSGTFELSNRKTNIKVQELILDDN